MLGEEHGGKYGKADRTQTEVAYQVVGAFEGLPALVERPVCTACVVVEPAPVKRRPAARTAATAAPAPIAIHWLSNAASLGRRVRAFLADVARGDTEVPALAWQELHDALTDWTTKYGAPSQQPELLQLAKNNDDLASFLAVFEKNSARPITALRTKPAWEPRYKGRADDVLALADWIYRQRRTLRYADLGKLNPAPLFAAGWCEDTPGELVPERDYYTGDLWPKYDRARARADQGDQQAAVQARKLLDVIKPALFDEIEGVSPRQGWVPLELVAEWVAPLTIDKSPPKLVRKGGLLQIDGEDYEQLDRTEAGIGIELMSFLGWVNHHAEMFRPQAPDVKFRVGHFILVALDPDPGAPKTLGTIVKITGSSGGLRDSVNINKEGESFLEIAIEDQPNIRLNAASVYAPSLDEVRLGTGQRWERQFREWCAADLTRRELIEATYQRTFQGYRAPTPEEAPVPIARWTKAGFRLHSYQTASLRRLLAARGGLAALDVGLGKTAVGIAAVAAARQEGWAKRPVVLVPNSLAEKWVRDILALLPDYRVGRIGWKKKLIIRGKYAGKFTVDTDTPEDRARTWSEFQAGEYDVVVMTYSTLARTSMDEQSVGRYAARTAAIERQVTLRRRSARRKQRSAEQADRAVNLSEREEAVINEGVGAWVAEQLELPKGWKYDPGITWESLGVDLLVVDEAQNFKNLFMPEEREGGVPKFMGNPGAGSARAWNLDFRAGSVRDKTGGAGIVLLSATPAKNSPLEFFNLLRYIDPDAFARLGVQDSEQFIDRYCHVVLKDVISISGEVEQRGAVVGFKNLDELRGVIFRYGDFKTAEQVGLPIPEAKPIRISVELDARQEAKYAYYLDQIETMRRNPKLGNPLGLMARLNLVAIHADLDEHYGWKDAPERPEREVNGRLVPATPPTTDARKVPNPHSPKLDAVVREVLGQSGCGHIVFCDNLAVHRWLQMLLVEAGIPEREIGLLNAEAAKTSDDRMHIAQAFTGTPAMINGTPVPESALANAGPEDVISEPVRPTLRVVIANQVAYEGVDLQTETCQIHHIDLPYEPATLQQRAGRAVRQGNKRSQLPIKFYISARSLDGFRFNLIQGKLGWMDALIAGTARATNNPAAQELISIEDLLIELSRDPEYARRMQAAQRERRRVEASTKIAKAASATLRAAAGRFTLARETVDPLRRMSLEADAEKLLRQLDDVNKQAWPWAGWAQAAREHSMLVPTGGQSPVYETLRVSFPDALDPDRVRHVEFGKSDGTHIGARARGSASWKSIPPEEVLKFNLRPEHANVAWPAEESEVAESLRKKLQALYSRDGWKELGWSLAPDAFVQKWWDRSSEMLLRRMADFAETIPVPVLFGNVIGFGYRRREGKMPDHVFPPTAAGWAEYLKRAIAGDKLKGSPMRSEIGDIGLWWWGRAVPRDLFVEAEFAEALSELDVALAEFERTKSNRVLVAMRAIEANALRPIDDVVLRRAAAAFEGLDEGIITKGLATPKVRSLIALRQRMGRAPAPASARAVVPASARPVAPTTPASARPAVSTRAPESVSSVHVGPGSRAGDPSVGSLRLVRFLLPNMRVARPKLSREALVLLQEQGVYATAPDREGLYATKPTWGTATEEMRRMLRDVPGVRERDVTAEYVFGRTRAARDYDYPWTLSLDESDPARRLVALPPGNLAHQVGRYESGNHRFERVLTSRADVIADMVERTDRGEITSDLADAALQAHDRVLDQLGKPMSDDPRAVAAYQAALGAGGKDSRAVPAPSASQRPASSRRGAPASRVPASSRRAPFSTTTPSRAARIERHLEGLRSSEAKARADKLARDKREMREALAETIRELVNKIRRARADRRADLETQHTKELGEAFLARAALRDPRAIAYWNDTEWEEDFVTVLARWARVPSNIPPAEQLRLFEQAARSARAPASAPRRAATDDEDELLAALELDPELEGAIELDGDDELMAAIELDPELEDALELDAAV